MKLPGRSKTTHESMEEGKSVTYFFRNIFSYMRLVKRVFDSVGFMFIYFLNIRNTNIQAAYNT